MEEEKKQAANSKAEADEHRKQLLEDKEIFDRMLHSMKTQKLDS